MYSINFFVVKEKEYRVIDNGDDGSQIYYKWFQW